VVALLVCTLLLAMAAAVSQPAPASAGDPGPVRLGPSTGSYYNPVAPRLQAGDQQERLGKLARGAGTAKHAPSTQTARLLTVLVEFNPNANDDFSGFERPAFVGAEDCVTEPPGTLLNGPLHNNLPDPATFGRGTDNNTFWVPDFSPSHYNKLIYTKTGSPSGSGPT
jgi:immune inhibitor A